MNRILIVDKDHAIRFLYQTELEDEGYSVVTTGNCRNLIDQIGHLQPDLILLDARSGQISGRDLLKDIKINWYDLPVILCSAYPPFMENMQAVAADYHVIKSVDLSELKSTVKKAFEDISRGPERRTAQVP